MGRLAMRLLTATVLGTVCCLSANPAEAQQAPAPPPPATAATPTTATPAGPTTGAPTAADNVESARVHYERGLQLFNEENYDAALFEFERAYELAPSYKILYNMGRIQRQQNNYAAAMRSYQRYLKEGGVNVPADRRAEIDKEIAILKPRVAEVTVKVNVDGAYVYADDIPVCTATIETSCIGTSPLQTPVVLNGGRHKITASKQGYTTATALVSVVGSDAVEVKVDLVDLSRPAVERANPWITPTVIGWTVTGATLVTAGVFGVLSLKAKSDQKSKLADPTSTADVLTSARDKTQKLSGVTDALLISTLVFAGVSTYFTFRMVGDKRKSAAGQETARALDLHVAPTGVAAFGTF